MSVASNPTVWGTYEGLDVLAFVSAQISIEGAQRAIFSMLFGAGVVMFTQRLAADERKASMGSLYYRRMIGLMLFGLLDMYLLLWFGDIIFLYGFVGLFLYFLRNVSVRGLLIWSGVLLVALTFYFGAIQASMVYLVMPGVERALEKVDNEEALDLFDTDYLNMHQEYVESNEQIQAEIEAKQQGYAASFPYIVKSINEIQWLGLPLYTFWDVLLMMMIGMALYRLNVFDASRTVRTYFVMTVLGIGIGVLINLFEVTATLRQNYSLATQYQWTYHLGRLAMACGYLGAIMLFCKLGLLPRVRHCLAAVGRMALTNYLMQSILCLTFFILLGFFGQLRLHQLYFVVVAIWVCQLIYSPVWLARYRYGPAEYLWRIWTYGRKINNKRPLGE